MSADPTSFAADDIDCNNFFDHMEDLLDFPEDNSKSTDSALLGLAWNTSPHSILNPDPLFVGKSTGCTPDLAAALSLPYEDIVQMEWLSTFVEDSFSGGNSMTFDRQNLPDTEDPSVAPFQFLSMSPISVLESSSSSSSCSEGGKVLPRRPDSNVRIGGGCGRARSKRPRPLAFRPVSATQLISPPLAFNSFSESRSLTAGQRKKRKMNPLSSATPAAETTSGADLTASQSQAGLRKCLHCEMTKTPQWRAGPMGPKTLCNACGVRYKSGRLFPEYRPAASPTFIPSLHSNSHKKVLEMRTSSIDVPAAMLPGGKTASDTQPEFIPNENAMLEYM
uniref:GATA transcription factor n=1 Tax=Kalanchoe fedtschenkoi TaxID=63787 RepID=A0A7N0UCU6_KALFE